MSNFGLIQPTLIQQIKKILDQYPDDGQILKELIQNAEDAGARKVKFLFDHHSYDTEKLNHPELQKFQGPALYAYNDAKFSDADWNGVRLLCESIKVKDPTKVGRFGLGFKSVFHMTDLPSVISGDSIGMIDPHEKYFSDEDGRSSGRKWHLENDREIMETISDQFAPYKGVFDCTEESFRQGCYEGTLFRLPLRQEASKLSDTLYSEEKIKGLFDCFEKDAHLILLFLMNLEQIEVYERDGQCSEPRKVFQVGISNDCLQDVRQAREEFKACLSNGSLSEVKKTYSLTIETVHYQGERQDTASKHSFIVTNRFSSSDVSQNMKELIGDESLSYMPWVGVALPFKFQLMMKDDGDNDDEEPKGHLFCFLPLPLENKSLTGLPVHVNGFFALSQNRRHLKWPSADQDEANLTDKSLLWNKGLLQEVLPKAYTELILYVTSCLSREESDVMMTKNHVYGAWPDITKVNVKWKDILQPLFELLLGSKVLHSDANDGVWCKVEDVILDNLEKSDQSRKVVIDVLNKTGKMVVTAPVHVKAAVEHYRTVKYVTPKILRNSLKKNPFCYSDLSYEDKILLLKFVLKDSDFKDLEGLELLPLSDKTFTSFQTASSSVSIYIDSAEHPKSLLQRSQKMFLDTEMDNIVTEQLKNAIKKGHTQLRHFDKEAVKKHLRQSLPPEWLVPHELIIWYPGRPNEPTIEWLKELWLYFSRHFSCMPSDLDAFLGLPLVPVSLNNQSEVQLARIQRPSSLILTSFNGESIDEAVCKILKTLGIFILNDLPDYLQHYPGLVPNVANPASSKGVLNALGVFITSSQNEETLLQIMRKLAPEDIRSFRTFLSRLSSVTLNEEHLLRKLPLFETFVGSGERKSRSVSINEVNVGAPVDDLPDVSVFTDFLDLRDHGSRDLARLLNTVPITHTELLKMLLNDALNNKYSCMEVDILVKHTLERFGMLHGKDLTCIKEKLQRLPFVMCSDNSRKKPTELFNPDVDLLRQVFIGQDVFPEESYYSRPEVNAHLKKLGLKGEKDITPSDIVNCASLVNGIQDINKAVTKTTGILVLIEQFPLLLKEENRQSNLCLHSMIWIPVLNTRPEAYPTFLPLKNGENGCFACPNDVTSHEFINLVGSVKPLVKINSASNVSKCFGWDQKPCTKDVIKHLKNVVVAYRVEDKNKFIGAVKEIYGYLAKLDRTDVIIDELREVQLSEWVWNGDGFSNLSQVVLENPLINLSPHVCVLPTETRDFSRLFISCGMKFKCDTELLLEVLFRIKENHKAEPKPSHSEVKRDLQLAIDILNELKPENGEPFDHEIREKLLVPINVENDSKLELKPVEECTYCDLEWLKQGHDMNDIDDTDDVTIKFIHRNIPNTTADLLKVPTLMSRILGAEELELGESFGQYESLLDRLRGLLEGYTDGLSVPKELIQNADDAGATEVRFLYDERTNEDCMTRLIDEGMKECQGPALWSYNNAVFSEEDFQNIVKLNAATKKEDSKKIGRFGLGFNSVYNLTDVPSFISRNFIVILDPHTTYLGKGIRDKSKPGIKLRIEEKKLRRLANQFKPYNGIFGCDLRPEGQPKTYNGTLFRFPLRTASQAQKSGIKKLHYDEEQVKELLRILFKGAESLLLFTQNVLRVGVYHLRNECTESPQPIELFHISKSCHQFIDRLESEVSLSTPAQELASIEQEFVRQSSILKASSGLMQGRMNENIKSPTRVLMKSAMILNCQYTISDHGKQYFALGSELTTTHKVLWLVTSCMVSGRAFEMSVRNKGLLPTAGVAAKLTEAHPGTFVPVPITMSAQHEVSHKDNTVCHNGSVFCFLPLPIHNGLPVHINGCFAVDDNRRHLREQTEDDKRDQGAEWNEVLMREVVCAAYITLLEEMTKLSSSNKYKFHTLWPRGRDVQTNCNGIAAQFYGSLLLGLPGTYDSLRMPKLFTDGHTWSDIQNVVFLEPAFRSNEKIGQVALDVFKASLEGTKTIVVDLPEEIFQSFKIYELRNEVRKKCYNKERFFCEVFFPAIGSTDKRLRDKLVLFAIDDTSEELRQLVSSHPCIPSSPLGQQLKYPKDLIHPNGKAAQLFISEDGRFPYGEDFTNEERLVKLKKLGMLEDDLEWHEVIERAESVESLTPYQKALTRTILILDFIDRKLDNNEKFDNDVQTRLQQIKFLPLMKKPKDFPLKWKGDAYAPDTFLSADELYPEELKYLACTDVPILDETKDGCGLLHYKVRKVLAMRKKASLNQIKTQLKSVITTAKTCNFASSLDELKKAFEKLYDYFQCSLDKRKDEIVNFLVPLDFILGQKQLLSTNQIAFCSEIDYSPYLCKVPDVYKHKYCELFKTVGVRESFEIHDYIRTLQEVKRKNGAKPITEELIQVEAVIHLLAEIIKKEGVTAKEVIKKYGSIFLLDSKRIMKPSNEVCVKDCLWMPDEQGVAYVYEGISPQICVTLGANTRRQETLRQHTFGIPFGQKEKLTNRLKRILTGYPCDESIMKELLQNADDAKASKICFIKDPRQHPSERVFEDCWKPLQGPALCVYNNTPFTESDIEGIQNLGEGSKGDDPNKTGQYGVGFNAVYHLTDVPTFISQGDEIGEVMCVFDPLLKYATGADISHPGVRYNNISYLKEIFTDVFPCYLSEEFPISNGTMFRFPLRNEEMAEESKICSTPMTTETLDVLLESFKKEMLGVLLFLNNIKEISVFEIHEETGVLNEAYSVQAFLSPEDEIKRQDFAAFVNKIGKCLQNGGMSIADIPLRQVSYVLDLQDSKGLYQKWFVVQRIGFENKEGIPDNVVKSFEKGDLGLLPRGGTASLISSSTNPPGKSFCFLPLPFETGLPVHINGHFALDHEARRSLWRDNKGDYRSSWNDTLLRQVVAPCYVALLDEVRKSISMPVNANKTHLKCSRDDAEKLLHSSYVSLFPSLPTHELYWDNLVKEVYRYMDEKNCRLLPVLRQESTGKNQDQDRVWIEWLPPTGQGHDRAFFGSLKEKLPEDFETLDEKEKARALKKSESLRDTLLAVNFNFLCMPMKVFQYFKDSEVNASIVSATDVIYFFGTYNSAVQLCKVGNLPSHINNTPFKCVDHLLVVLKYCKEDKSFCHNLDGLPLLLTQDGILRAFNQTDPVFQSGYCELVPHCSSMFLHRRIFNNVFYPQNNRVTSGVFKEFDVKAFASLLPRELNENRYKSTDKCVIWNPEDKENIPSKHWIWHVWRFLSNYAEKLIIEYDDEKLKIRENCIKQKLRYEVNHSKEKMEKVFIIQNALAPINDWCLLPATETEKVNNFHSNVRHILVPLAMAKTVVYFEFMPMGVTPSLKENLQKMVLPELNCRIIDGESYITHCKIARQLVAGLGDPTSILIALLQKLKLDSNSLHRLEKGVYETVLNYFNNHISLFQTKHKDDLKILPFYQTIHGEFISIKAMQAIVLPSSIPKADMDIWQKTSMIAFLKEDFRLKELYTFLGCDSKNATDLYCEIIFEKFHEMSDEARLEHLNFLSGLLLDLIRYTSKPVSRVSENVTEFENMEKLTQALRKLKFIPTKDGLKTASSFYDPSNEVFKVMFENKKGMFPVKPFCDDEWLPFLRKIGLIHEVDNTQFVQFAKEVEAEAKTKASEATKRKSETLITYLFKLENVATNDKLLNNVKQICFIFPLRVKSPLQNLHKQYAMRGNSLPYICFKDSVVSNNDFITWTSAYLLSSTANPLCCFDINPNYEFEAKLNIPNVYKSEIFRQLEILQDPTVGMVVTHCKNICKVLCQKNPTAHDQSDEVTFRLITGVMTRIYVYLQNNYDDNEGLIDELQNIPCIIVDNGRRFVYPNQVAIDITSDQEIRPYLYKIPPDVAAFDSLFQKLGTTKHVTPAQYSLVLKNINDECGDKNLHPNEMRLAFKATKGLFETIVKQSKIKTSEISPLFLPGEKRNPDDEIMSDVFLQMSSDIVFNDAPHFKERIKGFEKFLLVKLKECGLEVSNDDFLVNKLPESVRPRMLTTMVHEVLIESSQPLSCSSTAQELRQILTSGEFCHGLIRMIKHSRCKIGVETSIDILTTIRQRLSCINVYSVSDLRTKLVCNGKTIPKSEAYVSCFGDKLDEREQKIYVKEGADLKKYFSRIAIIVDRITGCLLEKEMLIHLPTMLSLMPCEIKSFLDELEIREDNFFLTQPTYLPKAGNFIHIADHHLLVDAFTVFHPGDYVGYELDDPSLRGEDGTPTYIYAIIIEDVTDEGLSSVTKPSSRRYRIDIGKDKEPIVVDAADLYMFQRSKDISECLELEVNCGPCSDKSRQTQNLGEILRQIKKILEDAWKLPIERRRKIIKRLFLTWHPDKNPGNEEFCTKVFQFIQGQIEKLEKGPSFESSWNFSSYSYSGSYSSFFTSWGGRASYHRNQRSSFNSGGGFSTFSWSSNRRNPQPGEATRWYNQAKADWEAASNDNNRSRPSYEWACFKCHQSAEKALKAAQYSKDADKTSTHSLTMIAQDLDNGTLQTLAFQLESLVGNSMRMRYPDQVRYPDIPHNVYTEDMTSNAIKLASRIIQEVKSQYIS